MPKLINHDSPHWSQGGTGLTNLAKTNKILFGYNSLTVCLESIDRLGPDCGLIVSNLPMTSHQYGSCYSLHCIAERGQARVDSIRKFWDMYDIVKQEHIDKYNEQEFKLAFYESAH